MAEGQYDIVAEKGAVFAERAGQVYGVGRRGHDAGEFVLVKELATKPFDGITITVDKGQALRFELVDGAQILDIGLLNRQDPINEFMSQYASAAMQGPSPYEGYTFMSATPFVRPMATIIRDTIDYERLAARVGPGTRHMFNYNNYRCNEGLIEVGTGTVNANSCNSNLQKSLYEYGGPELARAHRHGEVFCIFQTIRWEVDDRSIPQFKTFESAGAFRRGDYVELLAQQDLLVVVSSCPQGGQTTMSDFLGNTSWPVAVKVYDTGIDLPDVPPTSSTPALEYIEQGRPGMVLSPFGEPGGVNSFEWEAECYGP